MIPAAICVYGEVLFDHFPDGRRVLGGAPFNVAWHLQAFGLAPRFISRVGADAEGEAVLTAMYDWGMDTRFVQTDPHRPTGRVSVRIVDNEPSYDIVSNCAYDAIEPTGVDLPSGALLYHGSLALRSAVSRGSLDALLHSAPPAHIFLDVNLRPPWWEPEAVRALIRRADWVKLNHEELEALYPGHGESPAQASRFLAENSLQGMVLTLGAGGAHAVTAGGDSCLVRPAQSIEVVDTVGAGDAFAAVMILGLARGWPLAQTLERAQQFASRIVGRRGATVHERDFYLPLLEAWESTATGDD
jgi:fructokinase